MGISDCQLITLPKIGDERGNLTFIENAARLLPFEMKRVFFLYDIPKGQKRGAHAHKQLHQFFVCLNGQVKVLLDDGSSQKNIVLRHPWEGLWVPPMIWSEQSEFTPGTVFLVLASAKYDESDYIRDQQEFLKQSSRRTK